jgi:hypothetical protein
VLRDNLVVRSFDYAFLALLPCHRGQLDAVSLCFISDGVRSGAPLDGERQRLHSDGAAQLLEGLAPRVTPERLAAGAPQQTTRQLR